MPRRAIYLASESPRRQDILRSLGIDFQLLIAQRDEDVEALEDGVRGESARHYVTRVAALKAGAAVLRLQRRGLPQRLILAADTTVATGRTILGKPSGEAEAETMLSLLSGKAHRVLTAVAVTNGNFLALAVSETRVWFRELTKADIEAYIASKEPFGKAGAYAIQGGAAAWVSRIDGSYTGVVGLPAFETMALLDSFTNLRHRKRGTGAQ